MSAGGGQRDLARLVTWSRGRRSSRWTLIPVATSARACSPPVSSCDLSRVLWHAGPLKLGRMDDASDVKQQTKAPRKWRGLFLSCSR